MQSSVVSSHHRTLGYLSFFPKWSSLPRLTLWISTQLRALHRLPWPYHKVKHSFTYSCNAMCLSIQIFSSVAFLHVFLWSFDSYLSFPTRYKFLEKRILGFAHIVAYLVYWFINSEWVPLLPPYSCQHVIRPPKNADFTVSPSCPLYF